MKLVMNITRVEYRLKDTMKFYPSINHELAEAPNLTRVRFFIGVKETSQLEDP